MIDSADPASIQRAAAQVLADHPDLNVLVTMAGIMHAEDWTTAGFLESAEQTVTTNVLGPIRLISAFVDHLRSKPDATIVTVSSGRRVGWVRSQSSRSSACSRIGASTSAASSTAASTWSS